MNKVLKEGIDFDWLIKDTRFGPIETDPKTKDGQILKRITNPTGHGIVMLSDKDCLRPVRVLSGEYESNGRISNFWSWFRLDDPENKTIERGYGYFYESPKA